MKQLSNFLFVIFLILSVTMPINANWQKTSMIRADNQIRFLVSQIHDTQRLPRSYSPNSGIVYTSIDDWTSGFFPGILWQLYSYTHDDYWLNQSRKFTNMLYPIQNNAKDHDIGFMIMCSYGKGYSITADSAYRKVIINSAHTLSKMFCDKAKTIQSWPSKTSRTGVKWDCPVIIDNMMNLELLFKATQLTGDSSFRNIAIHHADQVIKNHIRSDFSTFHLVNYDKVSGEVTDRDTWQGFSRNSTWARGQAWAIYGFSLCYRETGETRFLITACQLADFYLSNKKLPSDKIPYWDFNVGENGYKPDWMYDAKTNIEVPRDASAAAIVASALFELSAVSSELTARYFAQAEIILRQLSSNNYFSETKKNGGFLLKHSVGNMPKGLEIDVPLNYADYYYLEAMLRYDSMIKRLLLLN